MYRILKSYDLLTGSAHVVLPTAEEFHDKTTRPNQLWQTDFTYLQGHRLGLVLPLDTPRRLQPLHHRVDTLHDDEG